MRSSHPLLFCVLGIVSLMTLPSVHAEVQKKYVHTTDEAIVWLEKVFTSRSSNDQWSNKRQTFSYFAGFTHPGKKYQPPTRVFFGIERKVALNGRGERPIYRYTDASHMVVIVKGKRTTIDCQYTDDHIADNDTLTISEKMVSDIDVSLLQQMSNARKVTIGFLASNDEFLGEFTIEDNDLKEIDELIDRVRKSDR